MSVEPLVFPLPGETRLNTGRSRGHSVIDSGGECRARPMLVYIHREHVTWCCTVSFRKMCQVSLVRSLGTIPGLRHSWSHMFRRRQVSWLSGVMPGRVTQKLSCILTLSNVA
jgi:hypothetical protein